MTCTSERRRFDISIGIPAYGRCAELIELMDSIQKQTVLPEEVTICEDLSSERETIRDIVHEWSKKFTATGCRVTYIENDRNLGYDGNIRKVLSSSHSTWVMLMGNDDLLLPNCIAEVEAYLAEKEATPVVSRSFVRFDSDIRTPLGTSKISDTDTIFRYGDSSSKMLFRSCAFVGGLIFDRAWANRLATQRYDGTLYYQIYLAAEAFCTKGIGYVGRPIVGGRANARPLFGSAVSEKDVHIPGCYTPKGRAKMWASVLRIVQDVGERHGVNLVSGIRSELEVRQSFHVFEMMVGQDHAALQELRRLLRQLGLFRHPVPRVLYWIDRLLGRNARYFYVLTRRLME